ncbi:50S ribosomal protein L7/L12 [candidate division WOR-3 bacterium JGI_Cruoil_03_51_56]|uniref:Large ribosomal subunit protein bL12 n=1 Tax=candidate division WOR-3 bacterium JGI_Cruoil_03_51_56 TaxID=1973747 RepID=A0A235BRM2_UNCW3|nr:MAG: 50S ribosomal protein L7/L12 [candidate division WOR-3 bacterium JGI_Cruoil_03_51_56]
MAEDKIQQVMEMIEGLTVTELARLVKELKEKFEITGPAFLAPGAAPVGAAGAPAEEQLEEQTEFTVTLTSVGEKKIQVLKELRALTQLGLKEAKAIIDSVPSAVKENVSKEEAGKIKEKLEEVGAKVEVK